MPQRSMICVAGMDNCNEVTSSARKMRLAEGAMASGRDPLGNIWEHAMSMDLMVDERPLSIAVVIATLGRPDLVEQMCELMAQQTRSPDILLFSTVSESDVPEGFAAGEGCKVITGPKGLTKQRNNALNTLGDEYDLIVFYDDDFIPAPSALAGIEQFFRTHPDVAGATGNVLADGINSAGISLEQAQEIIARHEAKGFTPNCVVAPLQGLYGCNMAYRTSMIGDTRFDERLPLYAWQEDIDFASSLQDRGRIVRTFAFAGVHQGVKHGRTPGLRLGYSQIVNPAYLMKKGTMSKRLGFKLIIRNFIANHLKSLKPEPWVDRAGRAKGNWIGLFDVIRGRFTPERIEKL